tara:strand:+ start:43 stop:495 length:453 start_codon:yes stop_codon:yes gene_type:complete
MGIFGLAKRGFGKALKSKGPGVIAPKPTGRGGKPLKPKAIRPGKKDGGMLKAVKPSQKGLSKLPKEVRNKMGYMKKGGKVKKFPDLTGDGKVTRADVLKGRGVFASGGRPGLYANIHAKRKSGRKMRKKGAKGAPTAANFARAAQTVRNK